MSLFFLLSFQLKQTFATFHFFNLFALQREYGPAVPVILCGVNVFIIFIRRFALARIGITDLFMLNVFEFHSSVPCSLSVVLYTPYSLTLTLIASLSVCVYIAYAIVQTLRPPTGVVYKESRGWGGGGGVALCYWQLLNLIRKSEQLTYKHLPLEATQQ